MHRRVSVRQVSGGADDRELIERKQRQIVEGASRVLFEKGFHGTSIRDIARACDMSMVLADIPGLGLAAQERDTADNGGAIALGHPLGCTGAKLTATLLHEMERRRARYGIVSMCTADGMGAADVYENLRL
ncbi:MAG: TetR family transcriptional regulator [Thermoleophilia bacterium]